MEKQVTSDELDFLECLYDPICMSECLFHKVDSMGLFSDEEFGNIRLGQYPMLSFEYLLDFEDPKLSEKDNFRLRENAGNIWCFGGRKFGKTMCVERLDLIMDAMNVDGNNVGFSSYDLTHIQGVLEDVVIGLENNPFLKMFAPKVKRNPYTIRLKNGWKLDGINMNIKSTDPGSQFYQKHFKKLYIEEAGEETQAVYVKRIDAVDENGCVFRLAGMTNFTKHSPAGKSFYDAKRAKHIMNVPQYINPKWDDKQKTRNIKEHQGEKSVSYKVFVCGEVIEDGLSVLDMTRVRKCYNPKKEIKRFEINRINFDVFKSEIFVSAPKESEHIYLCADVGETAPTEIIIISKIGDQYHYLYNITLYNLHHDEQYKIFAWLSSTLKVGTIGVDTTDYLGRAIIREFNINKNHNIKLVSCSFNKKIPVGFQRDDNDNIILDQDSGKAKLKEEFVDAWSINRLKYCFYQELIQCPMDDKLDYQLNSIISVTSGSRVLYSTITKHDHLLASFRVFAIALWENEFNITQTTTTVKDIDKIGCL